jgi:manganese/zinc/iron transport system permease protein
MFANPNLAWILGGCVLLGLSSGVLGSFAFLRRRSLMGDALAHAALPGVCLGFMLTGQRHLPVLLAGAAVAGLAGAALIQAVTRNTRIKEDAALGIVLSVFFGFGVLLLTLIQRSPSGNQAGLDKFIFGQAASLVGADVRLMAGCAVVICLVTALLFKEFKLLCFDQEFARGLGFPAASLDALLMGLIVLVVVIGLQAVGVVLMAALLITPAAAARFWTDRLETMVALAGGFGAAAGALGTAVSASVDGMPTGPLIVLVATALFLASLCFAPRRGLAARGLRLWRLRAQVGRENALRALYELGEARGEWQTPTPVAALLSRPGEASAGVRGQLSGLQREGLVARTGDGFRLTEEGQQAAYEVVRNHRLWEMFLMHEGQLGADHVDRDADFIEHHLPRDIVAELERLMRLHGREPDLPRSVHPL